MRLYIYTYRPTYRLRGRHRLCAHIYTPIDLHIDLVADIAHALYIYTYRPTYRPRGRHRPCALRTGCAGPCKGRTSPDWDVNECHIWCSAVHYVGHNYIMSARKRCSAVQCSARERAHACTTWYDMFQRNSVTTCRKIIVRNRNVF